MGPGVLLTMASTGKKMVRREDDALDENQDPINFGQILGEKSRRSVIKQLARGRFHNCADAFRGVLRPGARAFEAAAVFYTKQREDFTLQADRQRGIPPSIEDSGQRLVDDVVAHRAVSIQAKRGLPKAWHRMP